MKSLKFESGPLLNAPYLVRKLGFVMMLGSIILACKICHAQQLDPEILTAHFKSLVILNTPSSAKPASAGKISAVRWPSRNIMFVVYTAFDSLLPDVISGEMTELSDLGANDVAGLNVQIARFTPLLGKPNNFKSQRSLALMIISRNNLEYHKTADIIDHYLRVKVIPGTFSIIKDASAYGPGCALQMYISNTDNKILAAILNVDLQALTGTDNYPYGLHSNERSMLFSCLSKEFYGALGLVRDFGRHVAASDQTVFSNSNNINYYDLASLGILYLDPFGGEITRAETAIALKSAVVCYEKSTFGCFEH